MTEQECVYCKSKNIAWGTMQGIYCKDCKKSQYPNTEEEQKEIDRLLKDNLGIGK